ncbi:capsular exopolysaccharide synthesis family protein [Arcticibacter tournemirensis]|uniref:non-specific protein-tyrosine kinase n=1 Tax=Arcticibacter tournemirensis TaxID=699437 RepID=A0A5M9HKI5_9SPHI|nr:polysaccharide biosynthesis tyrosine autokinase [Arcticibacter tournemirensis]KAA8486783.1 polysaccharide biosynthesis tyrosine autokinase [Arcticibacter tournemirensis]TQM49326.1 capsular exopolysaccharide synthesis family protein [Arcticibacter tournemirensis]
MNNNNQLIFRPFVDDSKESHKDLREIFNKYLYHWPLFLLSMLLCLTLAYFYLKQIKPVYHIKAKLSIKDEKNKTASTKAAALEELNISSAPKLVESEMEILKSRPLIRQVVTQLQLWATYTEPANAEDLYSKTPVRFKLLETAAPLKETSLDITINSANRFSLSGPDGKTLDASFKNTLTSSFGRWKLEPTSDVKNYIGKTIRISLQNPEALITQYQYKINTVLNKTAPIVELKIDDLVPERGKDVLNSLIAAYKTFNIADKNKETESTLKFINERLTSLTGELTDVEKDVEGYKSSIGLTDISSQSQFYLDNVQSNDGRLNEVNVQLNVIEGVERYVNSAANSGNAPATIGITDPNLISLVEQLTKLQLQRDKLLAITPENNPIFIPLNRQIKSTKETIKQTIGGIKSSLLATRQQLQLFNSRFESSIKNIPGQERKYVSIKRQQGIKENLYVYLLQKREEVALSYASTLTDAHTVEEAYYEEPQSRKEYPLTVALLLGFLLPVGLIAGRDALRNRILTRKEIETATSAPIICELVQEESKTAIVVLNRDNYAIGEQFRALRTNLLHVYNRKEKGKVILFTSSISGEGKSFVTSNIGASLAISGRKTVVLELDLRRPKISKIFKMDTAGPGLSELLNGDAEKEDVIQPSGIHPNLFVMGSGSIPDNPAELLESEEMESLINELRFEYDNILIDSPPLRLVTDAMILAKMSDITLYLIRQGYTGKPELKFIKQMQEEKKLPNLNLVFNGIQRGKYGYGYNYDYSYYNEKDRKSVVKDYIKDFFKRF